MNLSLRQLRHLVVLSEERQFGRAAIRLGLSQPALSRSIKAMEDAYGLILVERRQDGVFLTHAGEDAVRLARKLLLDASHLDETLRAEAGGAKGTVFAGFAPLPARLVLTDVCTRVLNSRPGLRFYTDVQPNAALAENLVSAKYDFILCPPLALHQLDAFDVVKAGQIFFDMLVREGHPLLRRKKITLEEINAFPVIGAHTRPVGRQAEFDPGTIFFGLGPLSLTSDNYDSLACVTQRTDAVWMSSRHAAKEEIRSGALVVLPTVALQFPVHVDFAIVTLRGASLSPATRAVMDDVLEVTAVNCS
jgi:DNA-binding transcriptional LysR family regulator